MNDQIQLDIYRIVIRFVVKERRTLRVHKNYLPYVLALAAQGVISLGKYENGVQEILPR